MKFISFCFFVFFILFINNSETQEIAVVVVGDIIIDRHVARLIDNFGEEYPFKKTKHVLANGDILIGNFESCISTRGVPYKKKWTFRTKPEHLKSIIYAGFNAVNLANNHSGDFGKIALLDTLDYLEKNKIGYFGAGRTSADARKGYIFEKSETKIGFLGYSSVIAKDYIATRNSCGALCSWPEKNIRADIEVLKKNVDIVIVSFHWGEENSYIPSKHQKYLAYASIESGADVVIGHHPHVYQGVEVYKGKPIIYSLGNFVHCPPNEIGKKTVIGKIIFDENKTISRLIFYPAYIINGQPTIGKNEIYLDICKHFSSLSKELGSFSSIEEKESSYEIIFSTFTRKK